MSLIYHARSMGNLKVFDVRPIINLNRLKPKFERLCTDPYVKEGYRKKHIAWFKYADNMLSHTNNNTLYQSSAINPVHGGITRKYPLIECDTYDKEKILDLFLSCSEAPSDLPLDILMQFQRITAYPDMVGLPSVEGWHRDNVSKIGIICVARENVHGAINEFKNPHHISSAIIRRELPPGFMAVFDDTEVLHRVTELRCDEGSDMGYRDVILLGLTSSQNKL